MSGARPRARRAGRESTEARTIGATPSVSVPLLQALEHHVEPLVEADATDIAQNTERRPGGGGRSRICARGTGLQHQDESSDFRVFFAKFGRFYPRVLLNLAP